MRKLLLLLLALLAAVGVCQETPSVAWSLQGPPAAPAPAHSPNGSWLVLSSNDGFRVLDANYKVKWYIPSRANGARVPVATFSRDSKFLYALTNPATGEVSEVDLATGNITRTAIMFPAGDTPAILAATNTTIAAIVPTKPSIGGIPSYQFDVTAFDTTSLASLASASISHPSNLLTLRYSYGRYASKEYLYLFDQQLELRTGAVTRLYTKAGLDTEYWTLGVDPDGGLFQEVATVNGDGTYTSSGYRRLLSTVRWSKTTAQLPNINTVPLQFTRLSTGAKVGVAGQASSTKATYIDYTNGAVLFNSDLGTGTAGLSFTDGIINPAKNRAAVYSGFKSSPVIDKVSVYSVDDSGVGTKVQDLITTPGGISQISENATSFVVRGKYNVDTYNYDGTVKLAIPFVGAVTVSAPEPTTGNVIVTTGTKVIVLSGTTGAQLASANITTLGASWISSTRLVAARSGNSIGIYSFSGSAISGVATSTGFGSPVVSPDGAYIAGWASNVLKLYRTSDRVTFQTALTVTAPDGVVRIVWTGLDKLAVLNVPSPYSTLTWKAFSISGTTLTAGADFSQTFDTTTSPAAGYLGAALSPDGEYGAFFKAEGVGSDGKPTSRLVIKKKTGDVIVGDIKNSVPLLRDLAFSPDMKFLFAALGGGSSDRADFLAINVPNTIESFVVTSTSVYSGENAGLRVTLTRPAKVGGQKVLLTGPSGFTVPASVTVAAGATTANVTVGTPLVTALTTADIVATIPDAASTAPTATATISVNPPTITSIVATPNTLVSSSADVTVTVKQRGKTATNQVGMISSNATLFPVPNPLSLNSSLVGTFTNPTPLVTTQSTITVTARLLGKSYSTRVTLRPPNMTGLSFIESPFRGGDSATIGVTLLIAAPTGGETIWLTIESPEGTTNTTVTVPAGAKTAEFLLDTPTVSTEGTFKVTGHSLLSNSYSASVALAPAELTYFELSTTSIKAGKSLKGYLALDGLAGPTTSVEITTDSGRVTVPATVVIVNGSAYAEFDLTATAGARATVNISAKWRGTTLTKTLTILP